MTNIDTQIIFDKNGKPIPQYLDVTDTTDGSDGTMKPITKNSYPEIQDVNVTNQQDLPTDYPDSAVKQELELIKAQQQQILERLDDPIPTQLTGSNVVKEEVLYSREIRNSSSIQTNFNVPDEAKGAIISMRAYGVTGTFGDNDGWIFSVLSRANFPAYSDFIVSSTMFSVPTVSSITIYPGTSEDKGVSKVLANRIAVQIGITGDFSDGEGIDCEVRCTWLR